MQTRWKLRLAIAVPSALALAFVAWGGYWVVLRVREINPARDALRAFIETVRDGRIDAAYRAAAPELRCRMTLEQFRGLAGYYAKLQPGAGAEVELRPDWPRTHLADIDVSTHYDQDIPHHAAMLKLDGAWRVAWIDQKPAAEVEAEDKKCGARSMHIAMVRQPLRDLVAGFERGDYGALAGRFRRDRGVDVKAIETRYAPLKPRAAALKEAIVAEPVFAANAVQSDGRLTLAASFRAEGQRFSVRADLVFDGGWALTRLDVDAAPAAN